jgi:hypothetical protein
MRPKSDDYIESEFQSSLDIRASADFKTVDIGYEILLSVPELKSLVSDKSARVVIYIFCRDTWYTHQIDASDWKGSHSLDAKDLEGEIQIWTLIVAKGPVKGFTSKKFHPEYGDYSFDVIDNQILAIAAPESVCLSRDLFRNVSSLFDYDINHNLSEGEWRVVLDENRLIIRASAEQIKFLRNGENSPAGKAVLLNGIFLPALCHAINSLRAEPGVYENFHWAQVLGAKIALLGSDQDSLTIAQKLLQMPLTWLNKQMNWIDDAA